MSQGQIAMVVGVGGGLGAALGRRFAAAGMTEETAAGALLDPNAIAETYYQLHRQDRTAWTQELDLRPAVEKF